jgi:hypothetical protein
MNLTAAALCEGVRALENATCNTRLCPIENTLGRYWLAGFEQRRCRSNMKNAKTSVQNHIRAGSSNKLFQ